jgi:hypothetical protein
MHLGQVDMKGMRSCVRLSVLAPVIDPRAPETGVIAAMCLPLTEGKEKSIRRRRWAVHQIVITSNLPVTQLMAASHIGWWWCASRLGVGSKA